MIKPDNKKVSKQFLNYLKNTPIIPASKPQPFKQKQVLYQQSTAHQNYRYPMEGDFSKIGATYVLQDDKLRKKSFLYGNQEALRKHNQKIQESQPIEDIQLIKQMTKLQYLEKKGFLKPQQKQRLNCLRNLNGDNLKEADLVHPSQRINIPNQIYQNYYVIDNENGDPNINYQEFMSPKGNINKSQHHSQHPNGMIWNSKPQYYRQSNLINQGQQYYQNHNQYDNNQRSYY